MLKGKQLIDYTVNQIGGDKLKALRILFDEVVGGVDEMTEDLMGLINPCDLYRYLEERISDQSYYDEEIVKFLEKRDIPLPIMWGWKHVQEGYGTIDENTHFMDKLECYFSMYKAAIKTVENATCVHEEVRITVKYLDSVIIETDETKNSFTVYEM